MLVVADSGPVRYLVLLDLIDLLPRQFLKVIVPRSVIRELSNPASPERVRQFSEHLPSWIEVVENIQLLDDARHLDEGERDALSIAVQHPDYLLATDDRDARNYATKRNMKVTGTLGILRNAAIDGVIEIREVMTRLREQTNFRASEELIAHIIDVVEEVRRKSG